jgi:mono/diheme cytochrome c family protein
MSPSTPAAAPTIASATPAPAEPPPVTDPVIEVAQPQIIAVPASLPIVGGEPPVLVGTADHPVRVLVASVGLFMAVFLAGFVGPSMKVDIPGARSTAIAHSEQGAAGQGLYESLGCGACHTQMVRPVASDVGLGAVTLNDSNQVLGAIRLGPDLSDVGSRKSASEIAAIVTGLDRHSPFSLSKTDLDALVTYLVESKTSNS